MTITVIGTPGPQGSKRYVGCGIMIESSAKVKPWREAVKWACVDPRDRQPGECVTGPIEVEMIFTLAKPKSAPKSRRWPDRKPDLSKLVRSTEDALTQAGTIEDDARIVRLIASKVFPGEGKDSLPVPGCVIHIAPIL